jgi:hypothetical protein
MEQAANESSQTPWRQHGGVSRGQLQSTKPRAPDPSGVFETSSLNWATAAALMADPPQPHMAVQ